VDEFHCISLKVNAAQIAALDSTRWRGSLLSGGCLVGLESGAGRCHGRGRGFEPRRPRQIQKDLSPFWYRPRRYNEGLLRKFTFLTPMGNLSLRNRNASDDGSFFR